MKLIKCSDYTELQRNTKHNRRGKVLTNTQRFWNCEKYVSFIKMSLELGMFIPCDLDGNVLEKPKEHLTNRSLYYKELRQYQEALDRVLFEGKYHYIPTDGKGFAVINVKKLGNRIYIKGTIEDLTELGLELTPNAINHIK